MDDDLDAFFDDVENAVKDVQETAAASAAAVAAADGGDNDDEDGDEDGECHRRGDGPPPKRSKTTTATTSASSSSAIAAAAASPPVKSAVRVVAASSVPVVSILAQMPPGGGGGGSSTLLAPTSMTHPHHQPPLLSPNLSNQTSSAAHHHFNQQQHPPPPPPPPPPPAGDGRAHVRSAAGETWSDPTLAQWPEKDFRLFVGNLAKDLKQNHLEQAFSKYPSFHMARIMYDKATGKSRGYGFVSLLDPKDCARAIREMDQSWLGSRPLKVKLSEWKDREWKEVVKKRGRDDKRKKKHFGL